MNSREWLVVWARALLAVGVVLFGAGLRWRESARMDLARRAEPGFSGDLARLPLDLGSWIGRDADLDPVIARGTGADEHVKRIYRDRRTGVQVEAILLVGPPDAMFIHAPENCYPAAGYRQTDGPAARSIVLDPNTLIPFRCLVYSKGVADRQEVYYSWLLGNRWTLDPGPLKDVQRSRRMVKVQIGRVVARTELTGPHLGSGKDSLIDINPCEDFLKALLPHLLELGKPQS